MAYPSALTNLIAALKKLPGVGAKSAERFAFKMIHWPEKDLKNFITSIENVKNHLSSCTTCGCLVDTSACIYCDPRLRDTSVMCIVSSPKDVFSLEDARVFNGTYHVLQALLSPIDHQFGETLQIELLIKRIREHMVKEIILALDFTLEGDATALFIKSHLSSIPLRISRLAMGLPVGSSLDFIDESTLSKAFTGRGSF